MNTIRAVGVLYILSALWCMFRLELSAQGLGFGLLTPGAMIEYFSVYGGLQLGLGLAMIGVTFKPGMFLGGLFFSLIFSWVLAASRVVGLALYEPNGLMWGLLVLEGAIALALSYTWYKTK
ncbi:hypothetical protein QNI23_015140 [Bermanella sp. WJH001]|uniref:hypothetical protein n=1 Tax=Bermanella sp. WJH001 TaxID=3048005 RepID=UPI0024BEDEFE|nr:hypothetical protein [Bermanella sp. WJH001]MDJ1539227.1 hypothetical protein [Bermanella sp. WJH001]